MNLARATERVVLVAVLVGGAGPAEALEVRGTVFSDRDDDGALSTGDERQAGVVVAWGQSIFAVTDVNGRFTITAPGAGIVWARTPDGFSPGPVWRAVSGTGPVEVELPLSPAADPGELTFVHAADLHVGTVSGAETAEALVQAAAAAPFARFLVVTGDLTAGNAPAEFETLADVAAVMPIPLVPVIGNHDRYDGGDTYRTYMGPPTYSFDTGETHFIVLDYIDEAPAVAAFLASDLASVDPAWPVVVFSHMPPPEAVVAALRDAGIDYLFTGHWHSNRTIDHGGFVEYNTEPLVMAGLDFTPAGFRVVTLDPIDGPEITHRTIVEEPVVRFVYPLDGECVSPGPVDVVVAVEGIMPLAEVSVSVDDRPAIATVSVGGWDRVATVDLADGAAHRLRVLGQQAGGVPVSEEIAVCVGQPPAAPSELLPWTQLQGGPEHFGLAEIAVVPPLRPLWAEAVGGHLRGGSPVLEGERLFVPIVDFADETGGGVVALDARTGAPLWEARDGQSVHNAPAVGGGLVVFTTSGGHVRAHDAASGASVWTVDLGAGFPETLSWLYAAPTIVEDKVYVGLQRRFVAIDLMTGAIEWEADPSPQAVWLGSYAAAGVGNGIAIAAFSRGVDGVVAWDAGDGTEAWRVPRPQATAVNASPIVAGPVTYLANAETQLSAVDTLTGLVRWSRKLVGEGTEWGYGVASTPAFDGERLLVATLHDRLIAVDAASGAPIWSHAAAPSVIHPTHYQSDATGFAASPVVTGGVVWAGGTDGVLRALDAASGGLLWSKDLGAPILSAPVPSSCSLYVATFDGTVRWMVSEVGADGSLPIDCPTYTPPPPDEGCDCRVGGRSSPRGFILAALLLFAIPRARRGSR